MIHCPNCHQAVNDGVRFCPKCGTQLHESQYIDPVRQPYNHQHLTPPYVQPPTPAKNNNLLVIIIAVSAVIICALLMYIFISGNKDSDSRPDNEALQTEMETGSTDASVTSPPTPGNRDEHTYDWLSERAVTTADLAGKPAGELRIMRNWMFARHGYIFKSDDLREYFSSMSWYSPRYADVNKYLSALERQNINTIKKYENGGVSAAPAAVSPAPVQSSGSMHDYTSLVCNNWLSASDLAGYSKSQLRLMRNTIYARHGYIFKSADLRNHFSRFSWYNPRYKEIPLNYLSDMEQHNIELIKRYE